MWSGIEPDALRRAANTIALYGSRVPVEERVAIIGALWDQAVENEQQAAQGDEWTEDSVRRRVRDLWKQRSEG